MPFDVFFNHPFLQRHPPVQQQQAAGKNQLTISINPPTQHPPLFQPISLHHSHHRSPKPCPRQPPITTTTTSSLVSAHLVPQFLIAAAQISALIVRRARISSIAIRVASVFAFEFIRRFVFTLERIEVR
jgi:hypothetical protein